MAIPAPSPLSRCHHPVIFLFLAYFPSLIWIDDSVSSQIWPNHIQDLLLLPLCCQVMRKGSAPFREIIAFFPSRGSKVYDISVKISYSFEAQKNGQK